MKLRSRQLAGLICITQQKQHRIVFVGWRRGVVFSVCVPVCHLVAQHGYCNGALLNIDQSGIRYVPLQQIPFRVTKSCFFAGKLVVEKTTPKSPEQLHPYHNNRDIML